MLDAERKKESSRLCIKLINKWLDANIDHLFTLDWSELEKYAQKNDIDISSLVARDNSTALTISKTKRILNNNFFM